MSDLILATFANRQSSVAASSGGSPRLDNYVTFTKSGKPTYHDVAGFVDASGIDETTMTVPFTISTMQLDRDGDVVLPEGCLEEIEPYRENPVVFWNHCMDKNDPDGEKPIGTSVGENGLPFIVKSGQGIRASCKFHSETRLADTIFRLVRAGVIRAASISFIPREVERLSFKAHAAPNQPMRYFIKRWQPTEWSVCGIGVNAGALADEIGKGWIPQQFCKSLSAYAAQPTTWANGFTAADADEEIVVEGVVSKSLSDAEYAVIEDDDDFASVVDDVVTKAVVETPKAIVGIEWTPELAEVFKATEQQVASAVATLKAVVSTHRVNRPRKKRLPQPVQQPPVFNITMPEMKAANVTVAAPVVNVAPPSVNVAAPVVNIAAPPPVNKSIEKVNGKFIVRESA